MNNHHEFADQLRKCNQEIERIDSSLQVASREKTELKAEIDRYFSEGKKPELKSVEACSQFKKQIKDRIASNEQENKKTRAIAQELAPLKRQYDKAEHTANEKWKKYQEAIRIMDYPGDEWYQRLWRMISMPGEYLQYRRVISHCDSESERKIKSSCRKQIEKLLTGFNVSFDDYCKKEPFEEKIKHNDKVNALWGEITPLVEKLRGSIAQHDSLQKQIDEVSSRIDALCRQDPALCCYALPTGDDESLAEVVQHQAQESVSIPFVVSYKPTCNSGERRMVPFMQGGTGNLLIDPSFDNTQRGHQLSNLLWSLFTALPVGTVRITLVDRSMDNSEMQAAFMNSLGDVEVRKYVQVIQSETALREKVERLRNLFAQITQYGNVQDLNAQSGVIRYPYEVIVLHNYDYESYFGRGNELLNLVRNGRKAGIHFIANVAQQNAPAANNNQLFDVVTLRSTPLAETYPKLMARLRMMIVEACSNRSNGVVVQPEMANGSLFRSRQEPVATELRVPFGCYENGETAYYSFSQSLPHTMIVGTSGSGKSVLMHNILVNAMLKYDARYLEFYLMDFKLGGGELSRYRTSPHVSHLLTDGFDKRIVLEILNSLREKMEKRGRIIGESQNIQNYNRQHPEAPLPMIVLVADECHLLFENQPGDQRLQDDINRIVERIATEGRSQGVTFVFATQSLRNLNMPGKIWDNINNKFMLRCEPDVASRFLERVGDKVLPLLAERRGTVYQHSVQKVVQTYYLSTDNYLDQATQAIGRQPRVEGREIFEYCGRILPAMPDVHEVTRSPRALVGQEVSTRLTAIYADLKSGDSGENVLVTGINQERQSERVFFSMLFSLSANPVVNGKRVEICLIDNPGEEDEQYEARRPLFAALEQRGVSIIRAKGRNRKICELADAIRRDTIGEKRVILALLGHEKFRRNMSDPVPFNAANTQPAAPASGIPDMFMTEAERARANTGLPLVNLSSGSNPSVSRISPSPAARGGENVGEELMFILDQGSQSGVHVIMQVDKPSNINREKPLYLRDIERNFIHIVALNTPETESAKLPFDRIPLHKLYTENDLLRAYYYNSNKNATQLITPYFVQQ